MNHVVESVHPKAKQNTESESMRFWRRVQDRVNDPQGSFQISRRMKLGARSRFDDAEPPAREFIDKRHDYSPEGYEARKLRRAEKNNAPYDGAKLGDKWKQAA